MTAMSECVSPTRRSRLLACRFGELVPSDAGSARVTGAENKSAWKTADLVAWQPPSPAAGPQRGIQTVLISHSASTLPDADATALDALSSVRRRGAASR
jgi:hypothetical protein